MVILSFVSKYQYQKRFLTDFILIIWVFFKFILNIEDESETKIVSTDYIFFKFPSVDFKSY